MSGVIRASDPADSARHTSKRGPSARQVRGVPDRPTVHLHPIRMGGGAAVFDGPVGLVFGHAVSGADGTLSYAPVRLPAMRCSRVLACVEFVSWPDEGQDGEDTVVCLLLGWVNKDGAPQQLYTQPVSPTDLKDNIFRFAIPADAIDTDSAFTASLGVTLMNDVPALVRAAWLEVE